MPGRDRRSNSTVFGDGGPTRKFRGLPLAISKVGHQKRGRPLSELCRRSGGRSRRELNPRRKPAIQMLCVAKERYSITSSAAANRPNCPQAIQGRQVNHLNVAAMLPAWQVGTDCVRLSFFSLADESSVNVFGRRPAMKCPLLAVAVTFALFFRCFGRLL
jgi:hypothetical protein